MMTERKAQPMLTNMTVLATRRLLSRRLRNIEKRIAEVKDTLTHIGTESYRAQELRSELDSLRGWQITTSDKLLTLQVQYKRDPQTARREQEKAAHRRAFLDAEEQDQRTQTCLPSATERQTGVIY